MSIEQFKGKTDDELTELLSGLKKELFNLRFQQVSGELSNTSRFKEVRKEIARIETYKSVLKSEKKAA